MNWFIYIGGYGLGGEFVWRIFRLLPQSIYYSYDEQLNFVFVFWTLSWVWICWRFIR